MIVNAKSGSQIAAHFDGSMLNPQLLAASILKTLSVTPMRSKLAFVTLSVAASSMAFAFDRDGLKGGMSIDETAHVLTESGHTVSRTPAMPNMEPMLSFRRKSSLGPSGTLLFCDGKLATYVPIDLIEEPVIRTFFARLETLTNKYGPGAYATTRGQGPDERPYIIQFQWRRIDEVINLHYVSLGLRTADSVAVSYVEPKSCRDVTSNRDAR